MTKLKIKAVFQDDLVEELQKVIEELDVIQGRYETLEILFWQMSQRLKDYSTEEVDKFLKAQYRNNGETLH